jgi:hypothetical protein
MRRKSVVVVDFRRDHYLTTMISSTRVGASNNLAPGSARGSLSCLETRPRRRSPQPSSSVAAAFAAADLGTTCSPGRAGGYFVGRAFARPVSELDSMRRKFGAGFHA